MDTYFVRHTEKLDIDAETRARLWEERRIAIHFPDAVTGAEWPDRDSTSLDPHDYVKSGRKALGALLTLAASGGYVYSEHSPRKDALIGYVEPNTKVELWEGRWGSRHGHAGRLAILKSLRLTKAQILEPSLTVVVAAARPRQGTLMKWPSVRGFVADKVVGRTTTPSLRDLSVQQQEIMCSEFLRSTRATKCGLPVLARLLLPVGRTLRDIDIAGLAEDGSRILAQVTFGNRKDSASKLERLRQYAAADAHLVFFCDCACQRLHDGVHEFPISLVYDLLSTDRLGRAWLGAATGG